MDHQRRRQVEAAWVAHLRAGGSTPWNKWVLSDPVLTERTTNAPVPGAAKLETVRRLAEVAAEEAPAGLDFTKLAYLVLDRSAPGRGMAEQPLSWGEDAPSSGSSFGAPPVDPEQLPTEELVRVCVGSLAELVISPHVSVTGLPRPPRRMPWGRAFQLAGAPVSTSALRAAFLADRKVEGGRDPDVLVVATSFDEMLKQVWTLRVQRGAEPRWSKFVARWANRGRLPISADLAVVAKHWAGRVGTERVHVVVQPPGDEFSGHPELRRLSANLLGFASPPQNNALVDVPALAPAHVDMLRRLNGVLTVRVDPNRHREVLRERVLPLLPTNQSSALRVPADMRDWARHRSEQMVSELSAAGYTVHGNLEHILPQEQVDTPDAPGVRRTLDIALRACVRAAAAQ